MRFLELPRTEQEAVWFLQEQGLLHEVRFCANGHEMSLDFSKQPRWRCRKRGCRLEKGVRVGTFFGDCRVPLTSAVGYMYMWAHEMHSVKACLRELGMHKDVCIDWGNFMRQACAEDLASKSGDERRKIGGPGLVVEVYKSLFTKKEEQRRPGTPMFGGICRETREVFLECVSNRSCLTLMNAMWNNVYNHFQ